MRKTLAALAVAALALAGCGTTGEEEATVSSTPAATSTSATSSSSSSATPTSSTTEEQPTEEPVEQVVEQPVSVEQAPVEQAIGPTFVRCELFNGTALMSDGSTTYMESCDENAGGPVPGNIVNPTYTAEEIAIKDWYFTCVEVYGADYCMAELNNQY